VFPAARADAQRAAELPPTRADFLLQEGRWTEAESEFYAQSDRMPRDPVSRAALGRFLAMKGEVKPGIVLIEEARKFGLDPATARALLDPMRAILEWRADAAQFKRDSTIPVRAARDASALFRIGLPRTDRNGRIKRGQLAETVWHDIVDRPIGLDSLRERGSPIGIEVFEALSPSVDERTDMLTLHANGRSALAASGMRYQVLRWRNGVRVLVGERRVVPLETALRELTPRWWQLDLVHGVLVVR
jgi:hypothetical protein